MKKFMKKRFLALLIAITMVFAMVPGILSPALAATEMEVTFELQPVSGSAYKLVFLVSTPVNINFIDLIFSYDNTKIIPVRAAAPGTDVTINDGTASSQPLALLAEDNDWEPFNRPGTPVWKVDGTRTAFQDTFTSAVSYIPAGDDIAILEFYFRFLGGNTVGDITADTFRFEDGEQPGNFVVKYFVSDAGSGIGLQTPGNETRFSWGAINQTTFLSQQKDQIFVQSMLFSLYKIDNLS